jgi:hypothetical protein
MEPTLTCSSMWSEQNFTSRASHSNRSVKLLSPLWQHPFTFLPREIAEARFI